MKCSSTSVSPTIFNNPPCYFKGEWDSGSSTSTSYFELKNASKEETIYFFWPSSNWYRNFFLPTTSWTHLTTYLLILLLLNNLVTFSNYPNFDFTTDPTPIFVLVCFFNFTPSTIVRTGELMVDLGYGILKQFEFQTLSLWLICFFVKNNSNKKTGANKKLPGRQEPITPLSENYIAWALATYIPLHISFNPIYLK